MLKLLRKAGRSGALLAATLVVAMGAAASSAGVASAAPAHHRSLRAWLAAHGIHVRRSHTGRHVARTAIVGGNQISIEQAPWQVWVLGVLVQQHELLLCGGSIVDATHIVTAAHCLFNPLTEERLPAEDFLVVAGISNFEAEHEEQAQARLVESLRVHPYYNPSAGAGAPDDVAVMSLSGGLALSSAPGSAVSSIGLVGASATPVGGAQFNLTGFGLENPNAEFPDGTLNSIGMTTGYSRRCGGEADAVWLCASASTGSACFGDSGSGLTTTGATPALAGVMDTVYGTRQELCRASSTNGFVNLAAPEIRDFIEGNPSPPQAPRGGSAIEIRGVPKAGNTLSCSAGGWSGESTITYLFIDSSSGQVLQSGPSSTYALTASDVGRAILCEVQATNAGGTGVVRTTSLRPIEAAPVESHAPPSETHSSPTGTPPPAATGPTPVGSGGVEAAKVHNEGVALSAMNLTVQSGGVALAKLNCKEAAGCNGTLTLVAKETIKSKGHRKTTRTVKIGAATFSLEAGETGTAKIHLNATGRALLSAGHGQLAASLAIEETEVHKWTEGVRLVAQPHRAKGSHKRKR
jgi:hypothetical protein